MNKKTRSLVELALLIAIVVVMAWVPYLGYIPLGVVSLTIIHVPLLIAAYRYGVKGGLMLGIAFGVTSMVIAMIRPQAITDPLFVNPIISVLPRVVYGVLLGYGCSVFKKMNYGNVLNTVWMILCTLLHTMMVIGLLYIIQYQSLVDMNAIETQTSILIFLSSFIVVSILEGVLGATVVMFINKVLPKGN